MKSQQSKIIELQNTIRDLEQKITVGQTLEGFNVRLGKIESIVGTYRWLFGVMTLGIFLELLAVVLGAV